jgi:predicted GIY-YIG superfamily endonuclease
MLTTNMQSVIEGAVHADEARDHFLYLVRDDEVVWYIGQSIDPVQRLQTHLGMTWRAKSRLASVFERHLPQALQWIVVLYSLADCESLVKQYILPQFAPYYTLACYYDPSRLPGAMTFAEQALIEHYHPRLNVRMNTLPAIFPDEGTHISGSSSVYLQ